MGCKQTSFDLLQKVKSGMGSPDWNECVLHALDMPEWREMTEQLDWWAEQPLQIVCFSEDLKCWGAWDTTYGHKAKDITPSTAWKREELKEEELDDLPWKDERGPPSIRRILELFQTQQQGNFRETEWSACGLFQAHKYHLWTEQEQT